MVKVIDKPNKVGTPNETNGKHSAPAFDLAQPVDSEEDAVRLVRTLVESSRVREAREKIAEFLQIWPDSKRLNTAARILAPAVAKAVPPRKPQRSHALENKWILENARNYPGEWLLIFEDRLIASGPDLNEVIALGQQSEEGRDGVLWFQPTPEWIYGRSI